MTDDYPREPVARQTRNPWPTGPWDNEPDHVAWTEPETGYACCAIRQPVFGNWLGYVRVPPESLLAGLHFNDRITVPPGWSDKLMRIGDDVGIIDTFVEVFNPKNENDDRLPLSLLVAVHGGLTYSQDNWFGFDCGHAGDLSPGLPITFHRAFCCTYRSLEFVRHEVNQLAWQLAELDLGMEVTATNQLANHR